MYKARLELRKILREVISLIERYENQRREDVKCGIDIESPVDVKMGVVVHTNIPL